MSISTGPTRFAIGGAAVLLMAAGAWALWSTYWRNAPEVEVACASAADGTFVWVPGGTFQMGSDEHYPEERPIRTASIDGFWLRATEVTNREFAAFVEATGYITVAELPPPEGGAPGSAVFIAPERGAPVGPMSWWHWVEGADWRHPEGPGSSIDDRMDHPVTQVAYADAIAYTEWAGEQLPHEAQWEYAASAGGTVGDAPYRMEGGARHDIANTWQGVFPLFNSGGDGFIGTAPTGCFEANAFGLYDMIGNVWEWTSTPANADGAQGIIKGGSYLCAPNYCMRYRPAAREQQDLGLGTNHIGFRTVRPGPGPNGETAP